MQMMKKRKEQLRSAFKEKHLKEAELQVSSQ